MPGEFHEGGSGPKVTSGQNPTAPSKGGISGGGPRNLFVPPGAAVPKGETRTNVTLGTENRTNTPIHTDTRGEQIDLKENADAVEKFNTHVPPVTATENPVSTFNDMLSGASNPIYQPESKFPSSNPPNISTENDKVLPQEDESVVEEEDTAKQSGVQVSDELGEKKAPLKEEVGPTDERDTLPPGEPPKTGTSRDREEEPTSILPPPSTEAAEQGTAEAQEKINAEKAEQRNAYARDEVLLKDPEFVEFLKSRNIDPESLDVNGMIDEIERKYGVNLSKIEGADRRLYDRLREARGLADRDIAEGQMKSIEDKSSDAYKEAKRQFEETDEHQQGRYQRESIRKNKGLKAQLRKKGYIHEDSDIDTLNIDGVMEREGDKSPLYRGLRDLKIEAQQATLADGIDYDATPAEVIARREKIAQAGEQGSGSLRKWFDKWGERLARLSGQEIKYTFDQARGMKLKIRSYKKQLKELSKDKDKNADAIKAMKVNLENAKNLRGKALREACLKNGGRWALFIWLALALALFVGPAILPAKLMEWGGKGAGR